MDDFFVLFNTTLRQVAHTPFEDENIAPQQYMAVTSKDLKMLRTVIGAIFEDRTGTPKELAKAPSWNERAFVDRRVSPQDNVLTLVNAVSPPEVPSLPRPDRCNDLVTLNWDDRNALIVYSDRWRLPSVSAEAVVACRLALKEDPDDLRTRFQLAWALGTTSEAIPLLESLVAQNYLPAAALLGDAYFFGFGVDIDDVTAKKFYKMAASEVDYADALLFWPGSGADANITRNSINALNLLRGSGNIYADALLAEIYRDDYFGVKNHKLALNHFLSAFTNGLRSVSPALASMFEEGLGTDKNLDQAHFWYERAVQAGWKDLDKKEEELKRQIDEKRLHNVGAASAGTAEDALWAAAQTADDPRDVEIYLQLYPDGAYADIARGLIKKLNGQSSDGGSMDPQSQAEIKAPAARAPLNECDLLAANPIDPERVGEGVALKDMNSAEAYGACTVAAVLNPNEPRFKYQQGRAFLVYANYERAFPLLREAYDGGYKIAGLDVGEIMAFQKLEEAGSRMEGIAILEKTADAGITQAAEMLAGIYLSGLPGVDTNYAKAFNWAEKSTAAGSALGKTYLGEMYSVGLTVTKDVDKGFALLRQAADAGLARAQRNVGYMYRTGRPPVIEDKKKARDYFKLAAAQGDEGAAYDYASMLSLGEGGPVDFEEACKIYVELSRKGMAGGLSGHAQCLQFGSGGLRKDVAAAVELYRSAADKGDRFAGEQLAKMGVYPFDVADMQRRLNAVGFDVGKPDGKVGRRTTEGIKAYQRYGNLAVDGLATVHLYRLLNNPPGTRVDLSVQSVGESKSASRFDDF